MRTGYLKKGTDWTKLFIIIWIMVMAVIIFKFINKIAASYKTSVLKMESNIGEKVVLNGDTLMVTNYSVLDETYTLENGVEINCKLFKKLKVRGK